MEAEKNILTEEKFKEIPRGKVFATGVLPNSPEGLFMSDDGGELRWVAKKGGGYDDWAIYCHYSNHSVDWIRQHGDKVTMKENIQKCVPCDNAVFKLYRY
jgi:hypothetical protein